ncbi:ABC transporter ATP-binding protein [Pseudorhodoplanes sinuspersici]|uniref:ABC transporter ATP-binding protein n=1 Tax=Pseudorhodoplanes sinuspersici TaxID=1235591 RepID=A0A1W6ZTX2_9HYPH|nr:ABC transporter ATP-binding protein [Pseudorhodoplanes sinuspersici]ARQ00205.1 ABC transporter ATP-binding protein [Pseudorhodoplanes sinuspersici]RKE67652.1 amino acid/amide ABC transporter ATP-binding protein 2 (HAAT family) [Pseudorhodoplanes sinuspersici]
MSDAPILELRRLDAHYGDFQALFSVSMTIARGSIVSIVGANGAGKSTLLKTIAGLMPTREDAVLFDGQPIGSEPAFKVAARGIALVPEGRKLFPSLSVEENLMIGGQTKRPGNWTLSRIYDLFPILGERRRAPATSLSGGQQQMAAIGRALMSNPQILLCDEISLGLAPIVIRDIYARLPDIAAGGLSVVIVEQDVMQAMRAANHIYCLQEGRVTLNAPTGSLSRDEVTAAYFGV